MKRTVFPIIITVATLVLTVFPARQGFADDETKDVELIIEAPLDATHCSGTPPTVTVLGLDIDVSAAQIEASASATAPVSPPPSPVADDGGRRGQGGNSAPPATNCYYNFCTPPAVPAPPTGCAALAVGQLVEVQLASDHAPLAATEVKQDGSSHNVELQAPVQFFDPAAKTITLLGLTIDVSGAGLAGADDDSGDGHSQPIDVSQLLVGQSVEVVLTSSTAPFVASAAEVKNFTNQMEIGVTDPDGNPVADVERNGDPVDDVEIDVIQIVRVQSPTTGASRGSGFKLLRFHASSNGGFALRGLATGWTRISVTRVRAGETCIGQRIVRVKGDAVRSLGIHLRSAVSN